MVASLAVPQFCSRVETQVAVTFSSLCPIPLYSLGFLDFGFWRWFTSSGSSLSHNCCVYLQKRKLCKMCDEIVSYFFVAVWNCHGNYVHALFFGNMVEVLCQKQTDFRKMLTVCYFT